MLTYENTKTIEALKELFKLHVKECEGGIN